MLCAQYCCCFALLPTLQPFVLHLPLLRLLLLLLAAQLTGSMVTTGCLNPLVLLLLLLALPSYLLGHPQTGDCCSPLHPPSAAAASAAKAVLCPPPSAVLLLLLLQLGRWRHCQLRSGSLGWWELWVCGYSLGRHYSWALSCSRCDPAVAVTCC